MIPLGDYNPVYRRPYLTYGLIALNLLIFLWESLLPRSELQRIFMTYSVVPYLISQNPLGLESLLDGFRSMFFHASWTHVGFNMLYLWVFGDNIEDRLGRIPYILFYVFSGYVAVYAQVVINPESTTPMVGASGAVAGVMGGYLLLYPQSRIRTIFFFSVTDVPAVLLLGFWFLMQLLNGTASLGAQTSGGGTAFFAHIGGFVIGYLLMAAHRQRYGAPELSYYNIGAGAQRPPSGGIFGTAKRPPDPTALQSIAPLPDLDPQQRRALQARHYEQLQAQLTQPVWLLTEGRAYYGRILKLEETQVTVQEKTGQVLLPLENISKVG
jgi:membrane associated rhomboid family serine protease